MLEAQLKEQGLGIGIWEVQVPTGTKDKKNVNLAKLNAKTCP